VTNPDSSGSCAERWTELNDWLDFWFQPEKAEVHDFDAAELELFNSLAPAWLAAVTGADKIAALDATAEQYGRNRVLALLERICGDETRSYWAGLVREEGSSLDDFIRLLWGPLPELGFEFSREQHENGIQFCVTTCPQHQLAVDTGGSTASWLLRMVCATDPFAAESIDPPVRFRRTKTLMQGDDCCDHAYFSD
jgi:predicted ArsR family transcriptional regulator